MSQKRPKEGLEKIENQLKRNSELLDSLELIALVRQQVTSYRAQYLKVVHEHISKTKESSDSDTTLRYFAHDADNETVVNFLMNFDEQLVCELANLLEKARVNYQGRGHKDKRRYLNEIKALRAEGMDTPENLNTAKLSYEGGHGDFRKYITELGTQNKWFELIYGVERVAKLVKFNLDEELAKPLSTEDKAKKSTPISDKNVGDVTMIVNDSGVTEVLGGPEDGIRIEEFVGEYTVNLGGGNDGIEIEEPDDDEDIRLSFEGLFDDINPDESASSPKLRPEEEETISLLASYKVSKEVSLVVASKFDSSALKVVNEFLRDVVILDKVEKDANKQIEELTLRGQLIKNKKVHSFFSELSRISSSN